jgi:hypothetical protein
VIEMLERQAQLRSIRTPHVFFNHVGNMWDARNLLRAFYAACRKAGVQPFRFHDLRHTFASRLVQAGVDLYTVQRLAGGGRSRWCNTTGITTRKVCAAGSKCWIKGAQRAQNEHKRSPVVGVPHQTGTLAWKNSFKICQNLERDTDIQSW